MRLDYEPDHTNKFLAHVFRPDYGCAEIRVMGAMYRNGFLIPCDRESSVYGGWFDRADYFRCAATEIRGVNGYVTVNPVNRILLDRAHNKLKPRMGRTHDTDILCLRWIFVDVDPVRPSGTASTQEQLDAAVAAREKILEDHPAIRESAIWGVSGNGTWMLIRIPDLATDDEGQTVVSKTLACLAEQYNNDAVKIDPTTKNPSRIMAIPGIWKCKGANLPERPWRMTTFDGEGAAPDELQPCDITAWLATRPEPKINYQVSKSGKAPQSRAKPAVASPLPSPSIQESTNAQRAFGLKALSEESRKVATAEPGTWNATLNRSASSLYSLVAAGALTDEEVYEALVTASATRGHEGHEVQATITSGKQHGLANPRDMTNVGTKTTFGPSWEEILGEPLPEEFLRAQARGVATGMPSTHVQNMRPRPIEGEILRFELTDQGNGERLVYMHGHRIRFCPLYKDWLLYDGRRWSRDSQCGVEYLCKQLRGQIMLEIPIEAEDKERDRYLRWFFESQSSGKVNAAAKMARSEPGISVTPNILDGEKTQWLLNVQNGTLDLRTMTLHPHDPDNLITKIAPVMYDPEATCPRWDLFLQEVMDGDEELVDFLGRAAGYAATGVIREHAMFVLFGSGRNGKTTFLNQILNILGDYANEIDSELLMSQANPQHPTGLTELEGRRAIVAEETDEHRRLAESLVKRLTGGNQISARKMYGDYYTFRPTHHMFLAVNHKPDVTGTDPAIWARLKPIPFTVSFDKAVEGSKPKDTKLDEKLAEERSGILNWILAGCLRWQEHGLNQPAAMLKAHETYRAEMDVIGMFLEARTEKKKGGRVVFNTLYSEYRTWCDANGCRPLTSRKFGIKLTERGLKTSESHGVTYRLGLTMKETTMPISLPPVEEFDWTV